MSLVNVPFLGMRGTGDWVTNQRPENWRETLLYLYPNGGAPLTAILSMLKSESTDDPHYHWWTKALPNQRAELTGTFTDVALTIPYVAGGVAGSVIYARMSATNVDKIRLGHEVMFLCTADPTMRVVGKVTVRASNGANSYVGVTLLEADDNSLTRDISDSTVLWIIGNMNPEGGTLPSVIAYDPVEYENCTQIFRTPLSHTRTAMKTRLRTGNQVAQAKKEALELHGMEIEKAYIFGIRTVNTGSNGKPERTTQGIVNFIQTNIYDFPTLGGGTWLAMGDNWLDTYLERVFRFGSQEKLGFCGNGVLLALMRLAKAKGTFELTAMKTAYGVKVFEWVTAFGTLYLKAHPLFNYEATMHNNMLILDTANLTERYIDATRYLPNRQANDLDGEESEYLCESGLELHHEETFGWLTGIGLDSWPSVTTAAPTTAAPTTTLTTAAPTTTLTTAAPTTTLTTAAPTTTLTTAAPTTAGPTTANPSTAAPSTAAPTTTATTGAPTTVAPTTAAPTTAAPTTAAPTTTLTTAAPTTTLTTAAPTTAAPTTAA